MAIDFPSSPTTGQTYTDGNGIIWKYDGTRWNKLLPVDDIPINGEVEDPITSNWAYDHENASNPHSLTYTDVGAEQADATILKEADVDDTPVDAATTAPISSNWAYDHDNPEINPHLNLEAGTATAVDPNTLDGGIRIINHANGPSGDSTFYWIHTMSFNGGPNVAQYAISYGTEDVPTEFWVRSNYSSGGGWQDWKQLLGRDDVDDTPVDAATTVPVSSNWAYDHENDAGLHARNLLLTTTDYGTGNMMDNGTFDTDTAWTKGTGWTIASGVASSDGSQIADSHLEQSATFEANKTYYVTMDLVATTDGVTLTIGNASSNKQIVTRKIYDELTPTAAATELKITASSTFVGNVDNVECYEVEPDAVKYGTFLVDFYWEKGTGWTIDATTDYEADCSGAQTGTTDLGQLGTNQENEISISSTYLFTFDITKYVAGTVTPKLGTALGEPQSGIGSYGSIITCAGNTTLALQADADFEGSVDNLVVREVSKVLTIGDIQTIRCSGGPQGVFVPSSPSRGDQFGILDVTGGAADGGFVVIGYDDPIMGQDEDFIFDLNRGKIIFTYIDATEGWVITDLLAINA